MLQGTAGYMARLYFEHVGLPLGDRGEFLSQVFVREDTLRDATLDTIYPPAHVHYLYGTLAVEMLVELASAESVVNYSRLQARYETWEEAFEAAFGRSVDEFHDEFARHRAVLMAEFSRSLDAIRGTVVGPNGEGVDGVTLRAWQGTTALVTNVYGAGHAVPGPEGEFALSVPQDGSYILTIHRPAAAGCRPLGWYALETGFTVDRRQVAAVVVEGEDVTGVVIRLPASVDESPTIGRPPTHCAR